MLNDFIKVAVVFLLVSEIYAAVPIRMHCGEITNIERLQTALRFVKHSSAFRNKELKPSEMIPDEWIESKKPEEGLLYVVLTIRINEDKSISPLDYLLFCDGKKYDCAGMLKMPAEVYDFRQIYTTGPAEVKLVFPCSASAMEASLECRFSKVPIPIINKLMLQDPGDVLKLKQAKEAEEE